MAGKLRSLTELEKNIYIRNILVPEIGESGQARLLESRVLVVGLGGLGSPALFYLAASGVGEIGILDGDTVDYSNLQRQILHGREDVGTHKVDSAIKSISRLNPDVRLNAYRTVLTSENAPGIIGGYDFVIEATDNFESKFLVNDACVRVGKAFSHAGILGMFAQTMTVVPGDGPCYRCVFEEVPRQGTFETTSTVGVLGTVPGVMGAIQVTEAIKFLLGLKGLLVGRLLTLDALTMSFREVRLPADRRCWVCGPENSAGER